MSPDVLDGNYGSKSDIWSLGCVMYMLVAGALPFQGTSRTEVFDKIRSGVYEEPESCSKECKDLLRQMICVDVQKRLSAQQALEHKWFKMYEKGNTTAS